MAYMQGTPPANRIHQFKLEDFSGGLNNRTENILPNESANMVNMRYDERTGFTKRRGTRDYGLSDLPASLEYLDEYKPFRGEDTFVRCTSTALYIGDVKVKDVDNVVEGENFQNNYFFTDGTGLYVYGSFPQESSTYMRVEGTPVEGLKLMHVHTPRADYVPLSTEHMTGVTVYDYNTNRIMYEPCELEMQDTFKGANVVPEEAKFVVGHKNRLFISGMRDDDDNVFISDALNPFYFPVYLPIQMPPNSDVVRGLVIYDDAVVVGREHDIHAILGGTNRTDAAEPAFTLKRINSHCGFMSNKCINVAHNYLFFVGSDENTYALSSANNDVKILATQLLNQKVDFKKRPLSLAREHIEDARTYFFKDDWYITVGEIVLVYSYRSQSWSLFNGIGARCFYHKGEHLLYGRRDGITGTFSEEYLDFGEPFKAYWESKTFDMDDPISFKHFRDFYLLMHVFEDFVSDIRLKVYIDYVEHDLEFTLRSAISLYGVSKWGDLYINQNVLPSQAISLNRRGRFIRFMIMNSYNPQDTVFAKTDLNTITARKFNETLVKTTQDDKYYLFTRDGWVEKTMIDLNQPLKFYEISGEYEFRKKR